MSVGPWADRADWHAMREAWAHPPVEGVGYVDSEALLLSHSDVLRETVAKARAERYDVAGWRNYRNRWVDTLHGDVKGRTVIDFGCGFGLESLALAEAGATVTLADIVGVNMELAARVLALHGQDWHSMLPIDRFWPFVTTGQQFDVFYCNGVLHHIPWDRSIMERAAELVAPGGEARLMVYTDQAWIQSVGTAPPAEPTRDPGFDRYVGHMDGVGRYAVFYTPEILTARFGAWFDLDVWQPLGPDGTYAAAILHPREHT